MGVSVLLARSLDFGFLILAESLLLIGLLDLLILPDLDLGVVLDVVVVALRRVSTVH